MNTSSSRRNTLWIWATDASYGYTLRMRVTQGRDARPRREREVLPYELDVLSILVSHLPSRVLRNSQLRRLRRFAP